MKANVQCTPTDSLLIFKRKRIHPFHGLSLSLSHLTSFLVRADLISAPGLYKKATSHLKNKLADPISVLVLMGVAVTVIAADECYKAYKRRKARKAIERELGLTAEDRREVRRIRRQRQREQRERDREFQRRMREAMRRSREEGRGGVVVWDEEIMEGIGLPGYSPSPREGVDRAVTLEEELYGVNSQKKKGLGKLFKKGKKKEESGGGERESWFKRRKRREPGAGVSGENTLPPPSYEEVVDY